MKMLPGVGVFGTGSSARVLVPLLRAEGFTVEALWGKTEEEAKQLAEEMNITFYTSRTDDVLLHQDVDLVCINIPPPLTRQISVKALGIGKNVVCEKAATSVDAFRMVTASRYYPQLMSLVGNVLRFLPAFVRMKQLIAEHYVGAVMICDARVYSGSLLSPSYGWICDELMGGGGLHTMGTYIVDLLTHLTGQRAEKMLMGGGVCSTVTLNFNMPGAFVHEGDNEGMCEGPSRISGPIPPDPTLCPDYYRRPASAQGRLEGNALKLDLLTSEQDLDSTPPLGPRIGPGAREILERGRHGVVGVLLQLEGISLGSGASPKRKDPKDHEKDNLRRIREIQRRFHEQERGQGQGQTRPLKALWHSPKYDKVESRVKAQLQEPSPTSGTEPAHFLRAHSRCGPGLPPPRVPSPQLTPPGPSAKGPGSGVDFITHNARTAKSAPRRHSRSLQVLAQVLEQQRQAQEHYNATQKGHVPHYLLERRDVWRREAEARQSSQPDPAMPPGHTRMPENQRLETLSNLLQSQSQLLRELVLLPAGADSLSAQSHRAELDQKLVQVEEAIKIFSRPKVFVKMDA
nr:enkurin domain-containing protein 1 isoform X3 [Vicugna pacos]